MDRRYRPVLALLAIAAVLAAGAWLLGGRGAPGPALPEVKMPPGALGVPSAPAPAAPPAPATAPPAAPAEPAAAEEPPAPKPGTAIVVTVVAEGEEKPLEGATVALYDGDDSSRPFATRVTGADGVARFDGIERAEAGVRAVAPGRVPERRYASELSGKESVAIEVRLAVGIALSGVVLEERTRRPVPGAAVTVEMGGKIPGMSSSHSDPYHSGTTADAEGRFRLDGAPRREIFTIFGAAPGFVRTGRSLLLDEGAESHPVVEVLLPQACSAEGKVLAADGSPAAGALVFAFAVDDESGEEALAKFERFLGAYPWGGRPLLKTAAGVDGRFVFEGLRPGVSHRFVAHDPKAARSRASDPPQKAAGPEERLVADLRLRPPATLRLLVVDEADKPVEDAAPEFGRHGEIAPVSAGPGRFDFGSLPPGEYELEVRAPSLEAKAEVVRVLEGETKDHRVVLLRAAPAAAEPAAAEQKPAKARLKLVAPAGKALPSKVRVAVQEEDGGGSMQAKSVKDGVVTWDHLTPGKISVVVIAEGYAPVVRAIELAEGEERDLGEAALDQGVELSGLVQDRTGRPLPGARIRVDLPGFESAIGTADAQGRYRVSRLPAAECWIRVDAEGFLPGDETFVLGPGPTTRDYSLVPPVPLRGVVKAAAEGNLPEGIRVVLQFQDEAPPGIPRKDFAAVNDDGSFSVDVAAGNYSLEVVDEADRVLLRQSATFDGKAPGRVELQLP